MVYYCIDVNDLVGKELSAPHTTIRITGATYDEVKAKIADVSKVAFSYGARLRYLVFLWGFSDTMERPTVLNCWQFIGKLP